MIGLTYRLLLLLSRLTLARGATTINSSDRVVLFEHDPVRPRACPPHVRGSFFCQCRAARPGNTTRIAIVSPSASRTNTPPKSA
jgi:hypothetical protein